MSKLFGRRLLPAAALIPALAVAASPAVAAQPVDTTVRAACKQIAGGSALGIPAKTIDVRVTGSLPTSAAPGTSFTLDALTTSFTIDPDMLRPQVVATDGTLGARLNALSLTGAGTTQPSATVVDPAGPSLDLGSQKHRVDVATTFAAPPGAPQATFPPVGPWTIAADAKAAQLSLGSFTITLLYVNPNIQTLVAMNPTVECTPEANVLGTVPVAAPTVRRPIVTTVAPRTARGGQTVLIGGANFTGATQVAFSGSPAKFTAITPKLILATVPTLYFVAVPPPFIKQDVTVTTPDGTSPNTSGDDFYYLTGGKVTPAPTS